MVNLLAAPRRARGLAYLLLLFMVALIGVSLAATGVVVDLRVRREKEADLLFDGRQFRDAIDAYFNGSPAAAKQYPQRLDDLVEDRRFPNPKRYLRRVYADPFTAKPDWGLIIVNGQLVGVYSLAPGVPIKQHGFTAPELDFAGAQSYAGWRFVAASLANAPPTSPATPPGPAPAARTATAPSRR